MAVGKLDVIEQYFDNDGNPLAGGKIHTFAGGTLTPLAVYTDYTGGTAHANPIILDSAGRPPGDGLWYTVGVAVKVRISDANDVVLETVDNIVAGVVTSGFEGANYPLAFYYLGGPPSTSQEVFRHEFPVAVNFLANFSGAVGSVETTPASSFVATVKKNGSTVGTITVSTGGAFTFASSGGTAYSFAADDTLTIIGPSSADAAITGISATFLGTTA